MTCSELYAHLLVRGRQASVPVTPTRLCAVKDLWLPKGKLEGSYQEKAERIPGVQFTFSPHRIIVSVSSHTACKPCHKEHMGVALVAVILIMGH